MMSASNRNWNPKNSPSMTRAIKGALRKCKGSSSPAQMSSPTISSASGFSAIKSSRIWGGEHYSRKETTSKIKAKSPWIRARNSRSYKKTLNSKISLKRKRICWLKISTSCPSRTTLLKITGCGLRKGMPKPMIVHTQREGKGLATHSKRLKSTGSASITKRRRIFGQNSRDWCAAEAAITSRNSSRDNEKLRQKASVLSKIVEENSPV